MIIIIVRAEQTHVNKTEKEMVNTMKLYFIIYFNKINWATIYDSYDEYTNNDIDIDTTENVKWENHEIKDKKLESIYTKLLYHTDFSMDGNLKELKDSIESSNIIVNKIINDDNLDDIESEDAINNHLNKLNIYLDDQYNLYADIVFSENIEGEVISN